MQGKLRIHVLQHLPEEPAGTIVEWAARRGYPLATTELHSGHTLPALADFDWLVVMGSSVSVHEERKYPWLVGEKRLIEHAIKQSKVVVGVCLGAQLIADVLGARVSRHSHKEIGWWPIELTDLGRASQTLRELPDAMEAFHWHGDTFEIPAGAEHWARSEACTNQAFGYNGHVVALQFHLEVTPSIVEDMVRSATGELTSGPFVQPADAILGRVRFDEIEKAMSSVLSQLARSTLGTRQDS